MHIRYTPVLLQQEYHSEDFGNLLSRSKENVFVVCTAVTGTVYTHSVYTVPLTTGVSF